MCITNQQKERERWVPLQSNSCTNSSCHISCKYNSLYSFLYEAPSFLFSLIISVPSALLCFLYYGWFTLFYFFKFSITKRVEESGSCEGVSEVCRNPEVVIEEVINGDCFMEDDIVLSDEEIEEKEIMQIEKTVEAQTEEEAFVDDEKTENMLKPDVDQGCRDISLMRPPPWLSLCGMLEVLFQHKGCDWHDQ